VGPSTVESDSTATALRCIVRGDISPLEVPLECMCTALMLVGFYRAERTAFKRLNINTTEYACSGARGNHTFPGHVYLLNRSATNPNLGQMA